METFEQEGPGWPPLKPRTKKQRLAQGFGEGPILNRKKASGLGLRLSIIEKSTEDKAIVGVPKHADIEKYAAIHQFGGRIVRVTKPGKVRLRKNKAGRTVFAKKTHKRAREVNKSFGKRYTIHIPARPYLKFTAQLLQDIKKIAKDFFQSS